MANRFERALDARGETKHIRWHVRARRVARWLTGGLAYGSVVPIFWNRRALNILRDAAINPPELGRITSVQIEE